MAGHIGTFLSFRDKTPWYLDESLIRYDADHNLLLVHVKLFYIVIR